MLPELFLESEPEWRLYEGLRAANLSFKLVPAPPGALSTDESPWRTWFQIENNYARIRYAGVNGFKLESKHAAPEFFGSAEQVVDWLIRSSTEIT